MTREVSDDELERAQRVAETARGLNSCVLYARVLPFGYILHLLQWRAHGLQLSVGHGDGTYDDTWIYDVEQVDAGWRAALGWDGGGEPGGWYRHVQSGRRRPDGDPAKEFVRP